MQVQVHPFPRLFQKSTLKVAFWLSRLCRCKTPALKRSLWRAEKLQRFFLPLPLARAGGRLPARELAVGEAELDRARVVARGHRR